MSHFIFFNLGPKCNQNVYAAEEVKIRKIFSKIKKQLKIFIYNFRFQLPAKNGIKCVSNVVCINTKEKKYMNFRDKHFFLFLFYVCVFLGLCKKMLEAMTMAEHDGAVYCKQCYGRRFGYVIEKKKVVKFSF